MTTYEKSLEVLLDLFGKDTQFALATANNNIPTVRFIDALYYDGAFYVTTYGKSKKVIDILENSHVAWTKHLYSFSGNAYNIGHPLDEKNRELRDILVKAFAPWYFEANNEESPYLCIVKMVPEKGFIFKDGSGYKIDFVGKTATEFPFTTDIVVI